MLKRIFICLFMPGMVFCAISQAAAGGIDNRQNFSAAYIASPSRNAATDGADIVAYNPAGIMRMENGTYLELDVQAVYANYGHKFARMSYERTDRKLPFNEFTTVYDDTKVYSAETIGALPTFFGIYKKDKWSAFGSFTVNGGGGELEYDDGTIVTEKISRAASVGAFTSLGWYRVKDYFVPPAKHPDVPIKGSIDEGSIIFNGQSYYYTFTTGVAYEVNDIFSVAVGLRYVVAKKNIDVQGTYSSTNVNPALFRIVAKLEQEDDGFGFVIGANYRPDKNVNVAFRYESQVDLDWETALSPETKGTVAENILALQGMYDGKSYPRDLSAVLGLGVEWDLTPELKVTSSFTYYFENKADWGDQQNSVKGNNSYDLAFGASYKFTEDLSGKIGYMYTDTDMDPNDYGLIEMLSPPLDCHSFSVGASYRFNENISFSAGLMKALYDVSDTTRNEIVDTGFFGIHELTPTVEYSKEVYVFALSAQYKF